MKSLLLGMWTLVLLVLMGSGRSMGCLEKERYALLKIKAAFNHPDGSSLLSWSDDNGDCCSWKGVECDSTTSQATQLHLSSIRDGKLPLPWVIDTSLFLPLEQLQVLDLSWNDLSDLNGTLHLKKLKQLDLSFNDLERVPSLYKQTSTEAQILSSDQLEGVNLEVLNLMFNNLVIDALADITRITSLKALNIGHCGLNASSKLLEGLCKLRNLQELDIKVNGFWGPLPSCFYDMTSLRALDVQDNNFSGAIPSSLFYNLKSLEYIDLSRNAFEGSLSLASLANTFNLTVFHLLNNHNRLEVDTEEPTWFPSFQLKVFGLSNCALNKDANGIIPSFLKEQHDLRYVQLSHSGMTGYFPNWLLDNNLHLERLTLKGNNLSGAFNLPFNLNLDRMEWFDVSTNIIEGELPSWIGSILPNLNHLNLSKNSLEGRIPSSIGNMKELNALDLSNNHFIGEIPEPLAKNCTELVLLKLSSNHLQGEMLPRGSTLTSLNFLYLDNNGFTGDISPAILNSSLEVLDVSNNSLFGTLPNRIGDIEDLAMLSLSSNLLRGPLPSSFCNLSKLVFLDLSSNNLGPNLPPCVDVTLMSFLHLTNDSLAGHFPEFLYGASSIVTLDLRHNALSGEIPNWIGSLWNLKVLLLQGNNLEGSIPPNLCLLKNMSILDLSNNNLFGRIPSCLKDLAFGNDVVSMDAFEIFFDSIDLGEPYEYYGKFSSFISYGDLEEYSYAYGPEEVNFMTKSRLELYEGHILQLMSGMDLSQNNLIGFIPPEIGNLSELRALNLSHNHLTGPIPKTFSSLKNVESLDLSYNSLISLIPPQLTELYTLSYFSVAHNNLSGRTPDQKNQFGTFSEASYEGNPLLCGTPLTSCNDSNHKWGTPPSFNLTREDDSWREAFLWSFAGSYIVAFLAVLLFLYLDSYYQHVLFKLIGKLIPSFPQ